MADYQNYQVGSLCSMLYPAPGNIVDWMYGAARIKFSYAIHLRDLGTVKYSFFESSGARYLLFITYSIVQLVWICPSS